MIRISLEPDNLAAVTKSSSRRDRILPRTSLAKAPHETSESMIVIKKYVLTVGHSRGKAAESVNQNGIVGIERWRHGPPL